MKYILILSFLAIANSNTNLGYKKAELENFIEFAAGDDVGYIDEKIDDVTWRVKYVGMSRTSFSDLNKLIEKRIWEICPTGNVIISNLESSSVVAHRKPVEKRFIERQIKCVNS